MVHKQVFALLDERFRIFLLSDVRSLDWHCFSRCLDCQLHPVPALPSPPQIKETSALHVFFNLPSRGIRYALGYQMFGFHEKTRQQLLQSQRFAHYASRSSSSTRTVNSDDDHRGRRGSSVVPEAAPGAVSAAGPRSRVRLSGFGHVGMGGSVALCDPASGLAFAMVTNKVGGWVRGYKYVGVCMNELCTYAKIHVFVYLSKTVTSYIHKCLWY